MASGRIDWVDYAKGFCIIAVVMMHSTLGVERAAGATGWMTYVVEFCRPFRMPDFFLISGLFLANVIDRDWRTYLDRKVIHFAYFYILWCAIQFILKSPVYVGEMGVQGTIMAYLETFWQPFGTLWFIYMLPIFFVVAKAARAAKIPWQVVMGLGVVLEIVHAAGASSAASPFPTGSVLIDEFAGRFVYFYVGYIAAPHVFALAAWAMSNVRLALSGLLIWGLMNGIVVFAGYSQLPFVSLALGAAGACAVILVSALLSRLNYADFLRFCGQNSIVIYLAFFFPMGVSRAVLLKFAPFLDLGTVAVLVTAAGVVGPIIAFLIVRGTRLDFLFKRPHWACLSEPKHVLQPAE
ncbi:acyltransferase family protein [Breoghania sp.]|uniref:acyltransferase family protein n=1 Tax=Breoghania sp. TaxID=2065378 RepID=UPI0029CA5C7B|nr:acyltransferase family protein [Breoghania sp.]